MQSVCLVIRAEIISAYVSVSCATRMLISCGKE